MVTVIPVLQTERGSEELGMLPKVTHLVTWQGQILKLNLLVLKAVYTVPKQKESVSERHFGRNVITRDRNKTGGPCVGEKKESI